MFDNSCIFHLFRFLEFSYFPLFEVTLKGSYVFLFYFSLYTYRPSRRVRYVAVIILCPSVRPVATEPTSPLGPQQGRKSNLDGRPREVVLARISEWVQHSALR